MKLTIDPMSRVRTKEPRMLVLFQRAFDVLCDELKIADSKKYVVLDFEFDLNGDDGHTVVDFFNQDEIRVTLRALPMRRMVDVWAHEMVHVKDHATGKLAWTKEGQQCWDGKVRDLHLKSIERLFLAPKEQSEEREAYARMYDLGKMVMDSFSEEDRQFVMSR